MLEILSWFATGTTIAAAALLSANLGRRYNGIAFVIFVVSSIAWIGAGLLDKEPSIAMQSIVLLGINLIGVWRWLIRDPGRSDKRRSKARASAKRKRAAKKRLAT